MLVVHSSAIVSLLTRAPGFESVATRLNQAGEAIISPVVAMAVLMDLSATHTDPGPIITAFLRQSRIGLRPVDSNQAYWARHGFLNFGGGRWSLSDCFAYGAAKAFDAPLLATADLFANSDLKLTCC
jgi:ribonuclease VapC